MSLPARQFLRQLLESKEGQERVKAIWEEITQKRTQQVYVTHEYHRKDGSVDYRKQPVDVEVYAIKDIVSFASFAASYGVGKPPEEKRVDVNITARRLEDATDDELRAIAEGRVVAELPPRS